LVPPRKIFGGAIGASTGFPRFYARARPEKYQIFFISGQFNGCGANGISYRDTKGNSQGILESMANTAK
jgi:hypothetical protein